MDSLAREVAVIPQLELSNTYLGEVCVRAWVGHRSHLVVECPAGQEPIENPAAGSKRHRRWRTRADRRAPPRPPRPHAKDNVVRRSDREQMV